MEAVEADGQRILCVKEQVVPQDDAVPPPRLLLRELNCHFLDAQLDSHRQRLCGMRESQWLCPSVRQGRPNHPVC